MRFVRVIACVIAVPVIAIALFFAAWIYTASSSRAQIFVTNYSNTTLSDLMIYGSCKERHAKVLVPTAEWHTTTPYRGPIQFSFMANGKPYIVGPEMSTNDFGFRGIFFMVDSNLTVKCQIKG